jgi:hypothetical protein
VKLINGSEGSTGETSGSYHYAAAIGPNATKIERKTIASRRQDPESSSVSAERDRQNFAQVRTQFMFSLRVFSLKFF